MYNLLYVYLYSLLVNEIRYTQNIYAYIPQTVIKDVPLAQNERGLRTNAVETRKQETTYRS